MMRPRETRDKREGCLSGAIKQLVVCTRYNQLQNQIKPSDDGENVQGLYEHGMATSKNILEVL